MANPITVTATHDYTGDSIGVASSVTFSTAEAFPTAVFFSSQLDTLLTLTGDAGSDQITVIMDTATFSVSGWGFVTWFADHSLSIIGTNGADTITGGGPASNSITGGLGADILSGGGAGDRFNYSAGNQIAAGESVDGGANSDLLHIAEAGSYNFSIVGISSVERLDVLLSGPPGAVTLRFDGSQIGAGAIASISAYDPTALVVTGSHVDLSLVAFPTWVDGSTITINGTAAGNSLVGSSQDDRINGGAGADTLRGGSGNDVLRGGPGADRMLGGGGNDGYFVDNAGDVVHAELGVVTSSVSFNLADPVHCTGVIYVLTLVGTGNINGIGSASANIIVGNGGRNILSGRGGSDMVIGSGGGDLLDGGPGNDTLDGGPGNDGFRFDTTLNAAVNLDHVTDFAHLHDRIILKHAVFAAVPAGALPAGAFHQGTHAGDAGDRIVYDRPHGRLYYDPDGSGTHAQVQFAVLDNHALLTGADFLVV